VPVRTGEYAPIIPGGKVTTPYKYPGKWAAGYHTGEDWNAPDDYGKPVLSAVEGKVVFAGFGGWAKEYGRHVIVQDVTGDRTAHCHMSADNVSVGDIVRAGQQIGKVGNTGNTTGPHVHVERRHKSYGYWDHEKPLRDFPRPTTKVINVSEVMQGSFNSSVYWVQVALNKVSLVGGKNLRLSGEFGTGTGNEIANFQVQKCNDEGDKLIGPSQVKKLLELAGMTGFTVLG
jgi:murein DD-endopeptidase MepM/ murein hydrolase activator NlpD